MTAADITPTQCLILREMASCNDERAPYLREFAADIDLPVETVRRELRPLIEAKLVTYGPLFRIDDGMPIGSSYWLTITGTALRDAIAKEPA